jgi:hypothetical protein
MIDYQSPKIKTTKAHKAKKGRKEQRRVKKLSVLSSLQTQIDERISASSPFVLS